MTAIILILALVISIAINTMLIFRKKEKPAPESVRTTILDGIKNVSELATVRQNFQSIVTFSSSKKIPGLDWTIPGTTRKFMLRYNGTIVCGCDLTQVKVSEGYGDRVRITLPKSEILDMYADLQSLEGPERRNLHERETRGTEPRDCGRPRSREGTRTAERTA